MEDMLELVVILDATGRVLELSPSVQRILAFAPGELVGQAALDLVHCEDRARTRNTFAVLKATAGAIALLELRYLCKDGSWCPLEVRARNLLHVPEIGGIVVHCRELSRRSTPRPLPGLPTEERLQQRDERFRQAFAHAPIGLAITTPQGRFLQVNPAYEAITGYSETELLARDMVCLTHPDDRARRQQHVERLLTGDVPAFTHEQRYVRQGGGLVWVRCSVSLLRDSAGQPECLIALVQNLTEQRRLEEQCRHSQKMETIGRLAGGVAHDFNNLLTVITGYGQFALERLPLTDPVHQLITEITRAGERAATLTRQLLVFSRRQIVNPRVLDLKVLMADAGTLLRRLIGEDIQLVTLSDAALWPIMGDAGQVEQALMNLVVNARDAMPRGGKLTIETRNIHVEGRNARSPADVAPGPYVMVAVSDTGTGMTPEVRRRLYEPYFTTKEPGKGTGLGLATVCGIIKQAGGAIDYETELGQGTTFKLYFPRTEEGRNSGAKSNAGLAPVPYGKETILLVEDEEDVRVLIRQILHECGYHVLDAPQGDEAVRRAGQYGGRIDLLVTDVVMPQLGGRGVAERLQQLHPELKVLYLSGYTDDAVVRHGVLEKNMPFLQKPFSPAALAQRVREVLDTPLPG
jgi:PAS domain S-box-containing protein